MRSTACSELLEKIRRHLPFLFGQYGFKVIHEEENRRGENCLVVLESGACRLRFIQHLSELYVGIGTLSAPIVWEDTVDGVKCWYDLDYVLLFVKAEPLKIEDLIPDEIPFLTIDEQLRDLSTELEPVCDEVINLFREDSFNRWQEEFRKWKDERDREFKRQYEEWKRKREENMRGQRGQSTK